jgi:hypothetical protein
MATEPPPPLPPPYVDRSIFLTKARLRVRIVTVTDDPWSCDVTTTPAEEPQQGDELRRDQAELWVIYEQLNLKASRGLMGAAADLLTRVLDRHLIRAERAERMRRLDAPPPQAPPANRSRPQP